jgi:hypothetical protein
MAIVPESECRMPTLMGPDLSSAAAGAGAGAADAEAVADEAAVVPPDGAGG